MAEADLLTFQRRAAIADRLRRDGRVLAGALAEVFGVSEDTVRRDLREMAAAGLCRRVYGGALPVAPEDGSIGRRLGIHAGAKAALGRAAAGLVPAGSLVFIDAGSTNVAVAQALSETASLTVATNAPAVAAVLAEKPGIATIVLGGRLDPRTGACLGPGTMREIERLRPAVAILGACGVDAEAGITAHDFAEAELKAAAAGRAARVIVAATDDKLGTAAPFAVAPAGWVGTLVIGVACDPSRLAPFEAQGVVVVRADDCAPVPGVAATVRGRPRAVAENSRSRTRA